MWWTKISEILGFLNSCKYVNTKSAAMRIAQQLTNAILVWNHVKGVNDKMVQYKLEQLIKLFRLLEIMPVLLLYL